MTAAGHPRSVFRRALERGNVVAAEITAREIGHITLLEALELTALLVLKQPDRGQRAAARWLERYTSESPTRSLADVALTAALLQALGGSRHEVALAALRDLAATATGGRG